MNSTMYDCIQMENSAWVRLMYQPKFDTRRLIHRSGNAATRIDIIKSAGFNARIQLDGLNMYKTDTSYKGISILGPLSVLERASEKSVLLSVKLPTV